MEYFEGLVESMERFHENNGSSVRANGFKSVVNVDEQRRVDAIVMDTLTR